MHFYSQLVDAFVLKQGSSRTLSGKFNLGNGKLKRPFFITSQIPIILSSTALCQPESAFRRLTMKVGCCIEAEIGNDLVAVGSLLKIISEMFPKPTALVRRSYLNWSIHQRLDCCHEFLPEIRFH